MFLLNGRNTDSIDVMDRGLNYGDGLFETIAVIDEKPLFWDKHLQRLLSGCARLKIKFDDIEILESEVETLCKNNDRVVLKITITTGVGGRGYQRPGAEIKPTRLLAIHPWPDYPVNYSTAGTQAHLCSTRLGHAPRFAGIKHLNRLEQVLARSEWDDANTMEGLMLDINHHVISGTMSNLFVVYPDKRLLTPDLSLCGIEGIVRQYILDRSSEFGYKSETGKLSLEDVYSADEMFFCNSIAGIMPVKKFVDHKFSSQFTANEIKQFLISRGVIAAQ
jgi:4-amino-4-deoxychorismate lyase